MTTALDIGTYDPERAEIQRPDGSLVKLTPRENELLAYLVDRGDRAVPRQELLREVWGVAESTRTPIVDVTLHRLRGKIERDPSAPVHIQSVAGEGYRFFPKSELRNPAAPGPATFHLPAERDEFVGRSSDLAEIAHRLANGTRLLTVLGTGGTGKTRLVTRYSWQQLGTYTGGVWFCDLTEARDRDGILRAVASALSIPLGPDDPVAQLGHAMAARSPCLIVLDNFEQVVKFAPETLGRWLDRAADTTFLVTSRATLGLPGEEVFALHLLPGPEAEQLFLLRAAAVKRDFAPSAHETASVQQLVKLLDGSPLAIELAAARVSVLPPSKILERMGDRFRLLSTSGGRPARHATLRGVLDWSWELLSGEEKQALAQLSVFEDGFSLDAAESVLRLPTLWPLDAVQSLVNQSLVVHSSEDRFDLLVSIKEYARSKLTPEEERQTEERHGAHFAAMGTDSALESLDRPGGVRRLKALSRELNNLAAACRRACLRKDGATAANTALAALKSIKANGPLEFGVALVSGALAANSPGSRDHARLQIVNADLHYRSGNLAEAHRALDEALRTLQAANDTLNEGWARISRARIHRRFAQWSEAAADLDEAERLLLPDGAPNLRGILIYERTILATRVAPNEAITDQLDQAIAYFREAENTYSLIRALNDLANHFRRIHAPDRADAYSKEALQISADAGDRHGHALISANHATGLAEQGRISEAIPQFVQALHDMRAVGDRTNEAINLVNLGCCYRDLAQWEDARAYFQQASSIFGEMNDRYMRSHLLYLEGHLDEELDQIDAAFAKYTEADQLAEQTNHRLVRGLVAGGLSRLALRRRDTEAARAWFEQGVEWLSDTGRNHALARNYALQAMAEQRWNGGQRTETLLIEAERAVGSACTADLTAIIRKCREMAKLTPQ